MIGSLSLSLQAGPSITADSDNLMARRDSLVVGSFLLEGGGIKWPLKLDKADKTSVTRQTIKVVLFLKFFLCFDV